MLFLGFFCVADKRYKWRPLLRMERLIFDDNEKKKKKVENPKKTTTQKHAKTRK